MSEMKNNKKKIDTHQLQEKMQKVPVVRRLFHNTLLKVISLVFAIVLWSVVMSQTNPLRTKVVYDVPLDITGLDSLHSRGLSLATDDEALPSTVNVRLEVPMDDLSRVTRDNVRATLDLSRVPGVGEHDVNVSLNSVYGSTLSASIPRVEVLIESLTTSIVPVRVETVGQIEGDYKLANLVAAPEQFQISGPESDVNAVAAAVATLDLKQVSGNVKRSIVYTLVDENDQPVESANITSTIGNSVSVSASIYPVAELPIRYGNSITGELKDGYLLDGVELSRDTVRVAAPKDVLEGIKEISVGTIDLKNVSSSFTATVPLKKHADIYWMEHDEVDVIVRVREEEETKTFFGVPVKYRNLAAGHKVEMYGAAVDITVTMAKSELEKLSNEDIWIYVDLAGLGKMPDSTAELFVYLETDALTYNYELSTEKIVLRIDKAS